MSWFDEVVSHHHHQILSLVVTHAIQLDDVLHVFLAYFDGVYALHIFCAIVDTVVSEFGNVLHELLDSGLFIHGSNQ